MIVEEVVVDSVVHFTHVGHFSTNERPVFGGVGVVVPSPHGGRRTPHTVVYLFVEGLQGVVPCSLRRVDIVVGGILQRIAYSPHDGDSGDGLRVGVVAVVCPLYLKQVVWHNIGFTWRVELPADIIVASVLMVEVSPLVEVGVVIHLHVVNPVVGRYVHHVGTQPLFPHSVACRHAVAGLHGDVKSCLHRVATGHIDKTRLVGAGYVGGIPCSVVLIGLLESDVGYRQHAVTCHPVARHPIVVGCIENRIHQLRLLFATVEIANRKKAVLVGSATAFVVYRFNATLEHTTLYTVRYIPVELQVGQMVVAVGAAQIHRVPIVVGGEYGVAAVVAVSHHDYAPDHFQLCPSFVTRSAGHGAGLAFEVV